MPPRLPEVATGLVPAEAHSPGSGGPPGRGIPGALTGGSAWLTRGLGQVAAGGEKYSHTGRMNLRLASLLKR